MLTGETMKNRPFWIGVGVRSLSHILAISTCSIISCDTQKWCYFSRFDLNLTQNLLFFFFPIPTGSYRWNHQTKNSPRRRRSRRTLRLEKKVGLKKKQEKEKTFTPPPALGQSLSQQIHRHRSWRFSWKKRGRRGHWKKKKEEIQIFSFLFLLFEFFSFPLVSRLDPTKSSAKWTIDRLWRVSEPPRTHITPKLLLLYSTTLN